MCPAGPTVVTPLGVSVHDQVASILKPEGPMPTVTSHTHFFFKLGLLTPYFLWSNIDVTFIVRLMLLNQHIICQSSVPFCYQGIVGVSQQ